MCWVMEGFREVVWGWSWGGERCKLLLPGGEESQRGEGIAVQSESWRG